MAHTTRRQARPEETERRLADAAAGGVRDVRRFEMLQQLPVELSDVAPCDEDVNPQIMRNYMRRASRANSYAQAAPCDEVHFLHAAALRNTLT